MFCHKCGASIGEGATFCHKCGAKVVRPDDNAQEPQRQTEPESLLPKTSNSTRLLCPNCHSADLIPITETKTDVSGGGYGVGKGCCGWILLGPFGLLCGLCGTGVKSHSTTITSWVCKDCGTKFRNPKDVEAEENEKVMTACASLLVGVAVLYIAGNLLADNGFELFGIPNWIYIALGVLGMILGAMGALSASIKNLDGVDTTGQRNVSLTKPKAIRIYTDLDNVSGQIRRTGWHHMSCIPQRTSQSPVSRNAL